MALLDEQFHFWMKMFPPIFQMNWESHFSRSHCANGTIVRLTVPVFQDMSWLRIIVFVRLDLLPFIANAKVGSDSSQLFIDLYWTLRASIIFWYLGAKPHLKLCCILNKFESIEMTWIESKTDQK